MPPQSLYSRLPRPGPRLFVTSSRRWRALSAGDAHGPAARRDDSDGPAPTHWRRTRAAITSSGHGSDAPPVFPSASDPAPLSIHASSRAPPNTILQTCFFAISGVLPRDAAIRHIKESIRKTYGRKGEAVVAKNFAAVDGTLARLYQVEVPAAVNCQRDLPIGNRTNTAPDFVRARDGQDDGRARRRHSRQPDAGRQHLPIRHQHLREAEHRRSRAGLGRGSLYSMRTMQLRLPAQRHSRAFLSRGRARRGAPFVQVGPSQRARLPGGPL